MSDIEYDPEENLKIQKIALEGAKKKQCKVAEGPLDGESNGKHKASTLNSVEQRLGKVGFTSKNQTFQIILSKSRALQELARSRLVRSESLSAAAAKLEKLLANVGAKLRKSRAASQILEAKTSFSALKLTKKELPLLIPGPLLAVLALLTLLIPQLLTATVATLTFSLGIAFTLATLKTIEVKRRFEQACKDFEGQIWIQRFNTTNKTKRPSLEREEYTEEDMLLLEEAFAELERQQQSDLERWDGSDLKQERTIIGRPTRGKVTIH